MTTIFNDLPTATMNQENVVYNPDKQSDCVAIVSGGMDSVTLVYYLIDRGMKPHLLSFNYGQRHKKELTYAGLTAKHFGLRHDVVDLQTMTHLISNSALTSPNDYYNGENASYKVEVPEGHYAEDNMSVTVVPNRNMIMLSVAAGVAVNYKYKRIATGVHAGDHFQYPDCRPPFIYAAAKAIWEGNEGFHNFNQDGHGIAEDTGGVIFAPFLYMTKADIAERAFTLGVPLHLTWSCYKGGQNHCGRCGTCVERLEAIAAAKKRMLVRYPQTDTVWADATVYDDNEYWITEVRRKEAEEAESRGTKVRHMPLEDDGL